MGRSGSPWEVRSARKGRAKGIVLVTGRENRSFLKEERGRDTVAEGSRQGKKRLKGPEDNLVK